MENSQTPLDRLEHRQRQAISHGIKPHETLLHGWAIICTTNAPLKMSSIRSAQAYFDQLSGSQRRPSASTPQKGLSCGTADDFITTAVRSSLPKEGQEKEEDGQDLSAAQFQSFKNNCRASCRFGGCGTLAQCRRASASAYVCAGTIFCE